MYKNMACTSKDEDMNFEINTQTNTDMKAKTNTNTDVKAFLKRCIKPGQRYVVMGIGSTLRSDDGVGIYFIEQLSRTVQQDNMLRDNILLIAGSTAPENFTGEIKTFTPSTLFIVDAACMGLTPGETKIIPASDISGVSFSTHMMPLSVLLNYLEAEIGCNVVFIGIQPESTEPGFSISEDVKKGAELLAKEFSFAFVHYLTRRTSLDNR
ncbi:MAG TPA: hydrogenase maturation peptidase HycI [Clostridiaceae bacterium]|nr:hydrogenase maturation peptidase HycI [Clostridiaceae bacterium]